MFPYFLCYDTIGDNTEFWHETLSWRSPIGLTQSDLITSLSHGIADWVSPVSETCFFTLSKSASRFLGHVAINANDSADLAPSLPCSDEQTVKSNHKTG